MKRRRDGLLFAAIFLFGALPLVGEPYTLRLGTFACMYAVMAVSWHVIGGLAGYPSFGTAAFFGLGAYAGGIMLAQGHSLPLAAATAGAIAFGGAMLLGAVLLRLRGHYFAIASLAVAEVLRELTNTATDLTGGGMGLNIPLDTGLAAGMAGIIAEASYFFIAMWALLLVTLVVVVLVERSRLGFGLACIRQNELRARFLGYPVWRLKFAVFVLSTAIAGLSGALFAMAQQSAYPNVMSLHQSGFVVMMVLVGGGLASFWGPLVGAAFFILARDLLGAYTETWLLWYGLVFIAVVLWKPEGLAGIGRSLAARVRRG